MGWKVAGSLVPAGNRAGCKVVSATDFVASGSLEFPKGDFAWFLESPLLFSGMESLLFADSACEFCCSAGMAASADETVVWKTPPLGAVREASE